jgi:HAD superfamily hydrolase (TIGR01509 family)
MSLVSSSFAAVLFDCDGVLVDSETIANRALYQSLTDVNIAITLEEVAEIFTGHSFKSCVSKIEGLLGGSVPDDFVSNNRKYFRAMMEKELLPMPGIVPVLDALRLPYAVVTNSQTRELDIKLEFTGLDKFFPLVKRFDAESLGVAKPDPEIYCRSATALGVDIKQCLIVEDSLPGITAASLSGATVWAYRPHINAQQQQELGVKRVFMEWSEFATML